MEDQMVVSAANNNTCSRAPNMLERKVGGARPKEQALNCPRCNSTNTKFCYYNNYSLTQPRYFCKTCRRYWTNGGSLRNVPVGGGSRKNKRSTSAPTTTSSKKISDHLMITQSYNSRNPKIHEGHDLNLAFPSSDHHYNNISEFIVDHNNENHNPTSSCASMSALELLRSRGLNSFMPMQPIQDPTTTATYASSGFALQDFKPTLNFGVDGLGGNGYSSNGTSTIQGVVQESNGRFLLPFENLRQVSSTTEFDHQSRVGGESNGYWSGMLGGGTTGSW
ncbi:hypothetical protein GIB67_001601 [Kingdonia uniflora]|uniref:Dof zinc finger protein n=1 Tax=Kingdonia uniflora TaxID=39325 RepID=A0A7J7L0V1_9MAGN|nr:hypothetical protein GIB67_001601 [Kingdonia uniflora]